MLDNPHEELGIKHKGDYKVYILFHSPKGILVDEETGNFKK